MKKTLNSKLFSSETGAEVKKYLRHNVDYRGSFSNSGASISCEKRKDMCNGKLIKKYSLCRFFLWV